MGKSKASSIVTLQGKKLIPFGYYGGKFSHLDWLLPLLPECHHYCEPFAGSGHSTKDRRVESLWTNYDPKNIIKADINFQNEGVQKSFNELGVIL